MSDKRQVEEKHFVEEVGIFFEQTGMPRMAGRILGWLMISNPPHQTTTEPEDPGFDQPAAQSVHGRGSL